MKVQKVLILAAWMSSSPLLAQGLPPFCTSPLIDGLGGLSGHLSFNPANPDGADPIVITAGRHVFIPASISASLQDRTIDVYITGQMDGFTTPRGDSCLSASLTPLPAGTYIVNVYSTDTALPNDAPQLFLSQALTVTGGGQGGVQQPVSAPTASLGVLGALGALLAIGGVFALSRRNNRAES